MTAKGISGGGAARRAVRGPPPMNAHPHPLAGRRVVVTRTREQASVLAQRISSLGATVIELPVIRITKEVSKETLSDVMLEFGSYDWLVFTSANGVRYFFEEFLRLFDDIRALGLVRIAAIGDGTAGGLADLHLRIDCQPKKATAGALADELIASETVENEKILVVTGNLNRDTLLTRLEGAGAIVDSLQVYKTEKADLSGDGAAADFRLHGADAILFASSSAAEAYVDQGKAVALAPGALRPLAGSIGPQTSERMRACGIGVDFEAKEPGFDGLIEALVRRLPPKDQ
jgi:uroporphyrinogen-III synthase